MGEQEATVDALVAVIIASHGDKAATVLTGRIDDCRRNGDTEGVRIWEKVAAKILMRSSKRK